MLRDQELLAAADFAAIEAGLTALAAEHEQGLWRVELADEDVHTALEQRLTARIGEAGGRVHLGRSRNDQVLAALRLWMKDEVAALAAGARAVAAALGEVAAHHAELALPGYTHLQPAMPSSVALWAGGFAAGSRGRRAGARRVPAPHRPEPARLGGRLRHAGSRDRPRSHPQGTRLRDHPGAGHRRAARPRQSRGPAPVRGPSADGDCGRLASDLVLFATREFAFVELPEEMTTGSSIMPQKRNPDLFELVRGRGATTLGLLIEALAIPAKLPSGYHRDLQLLKAPLFKACDLARATTELLAATLPRLRFLPAAGELPPELFAAEEANRLVVAEGIPFREAYRRVAARLSSGR